MTLYKTLNIKNEIMKIINSNILIATIVVSFFLIYSCELDNYDGPDSTIHGSIIDIETGALIEQDIVNGSQIEYFEHGFENPTLQYMRFKTDGTYRNNLMFSGTYTIQPVRGNFVPVEAEDIVVKGETRLDFQVQPYIRLNDVSIEKVGTKIIARFKVQQTVSNDVWKIGLYSHQSPIPSDRAYLVSSEEYIEDSVDPNIFQTLEIDIPSNSSELINGKTYFFRVGAMIDVPEAKSNFSSVIKIEI